MTDLETIARVIDAYAGAAGDPGVSPLGGVVVPVRFLQALRKALKGEP